MVKERESLGYLAALYWQEMSFKSLLEPQNLIQLNVAGLFH